MAIRIWPPPEEIQTLQEEDAAKQPEEKWDKAEAWVLEVLSVKDSSSKMIKQKLQVWEVSIHFPEKRVVI